MLLTLFVTQNCEDMLHERINPSLKDYPLLAVCDFIERIRNCSPSMKATRG